MGLITLQMLLIQMRSEQGSDLLYLKHLKSKLL